MAIRNKSLCAPILHQHQWWTNVWETPCRAEKKSLDVWSIRKENEKKKHSWWLSGTNVHIAKGKDEPVIFSSVATTSNVFDDASCLKVITNVAFIRGTCIHRIKLWAYFDSVMLIITIEKWIYSYRSCSAQGALYSCMVRAISDK